MSLADIAVVGAYFAAILLLGTVFCRQQKSLREYFLGSRNIPWWAAACSGIATMASAVGYLGAPGQAFKSDLSYLQLRLGVLPVMAIICLLLIPFFYRLEVYTAYEYLEKRFDLKTRLLAGTLFMLLKCFYLGIVIYAPAIVVTQMTGLPLPWVILATGAVTTFYTMLGGMRAVIWTDSLQLGVLMAGVAAAVWTILSRVDGGLARVFEVAHAEGKLKVLDFSTSLHTEFTVWGGLLGGTFFMLAQYGVDQAELQRFLTTSSIRNSRRAIISTLIVTSIYGTVLFLLGSALYVFYLQHPEKNGLAVNPDRVFPKFIIEELPVGVRGLVIAGIFAAAMSTVSSVLNSLTTVTLSDFYQRLSGKSGTVRLARMVTAGIGALGTSIAFYGESFGGILVASGRISNFFGGSLAGIFLLGMLSKRANGTGAFLGALCGFAGVAALSAFTTVSWVWHAVFSAATAMIMGSLLSRLFAPPPETKLRGLVRGMRAPQQEEVRK